MANKSINVEVNGVKYESKSDAIRALLTQGVKKSEVAKQLDAHYSFVMTIERAMLFAQSEEGQKYAAQKALAKEIANELRFEAKIKASEEKAAKKADREAARAAKKAEKVTADAKKKAATKQEEKAAKKATAKKVAKAAKKAEAVVVDETNIAEMLGTDEIPAEIRADMIQDGLLDA